MGFDTRAIIDVRQTGSDSNAGMFNPNNANMATDLAATVANTSAPVVTSASYNFVAGDVGAWVFVKSGTNWLPGWYQIASVASNAATLAASIGSGILYNTVGAAGPSTAVGCASTASPTAGTWTVDYSQQDSPQFTFTDLVIDGTTNTKFTSAGNPVGKNFIANHANVTSGTGFTVQRVEVVSTSGTTATCDKSLGTLSSTGGNGKLGGGLVTPGMAAAIINLTGGANGMTVFLKYSATAYEMTNNSSVAGGYMNLSNGGSNSVILSICGYDTHRHLANTDANRPIVQPATGANSITCIKPSNLTAVVNIDFENAHSATSCTACQLFSTSNLVYNCKANAYATGFMLGQNGGGNSNEAFFCEAVGCTTGFEGWGNNGAACYFCTAHDYTGSTAIGFRQLVILVDCIAYAGTNQGFYLNLAAGMCLNCTADAIAAGGATTPAGFFLNNGGWQIFNACSTNGGGYGFRAQSAGFTQTRIINCATYNNTSGDYHSNLVTGENIAGAITLSGTPYPGSGNFAPNATSGAGSLLRAAGYPATLLPSTSNYRDVGAAQTSSAASGGSTIVQYRRVR